MTTKSFKPGSENEKGKHSKNRSNNVKKQLLRSNPFLNFPTPHKKFRQYCAVKRSSDLSYKVNKPFFLDYCQQIVQSGGIGALQKLIKEAINQKYENYPDINFIDDTAGMIKVNQVKVVQENEVSHQKQIFLQLKKDVQLPPSNTNKEKSNSNETKKLKQAKKRAVSFADMNITYSEETKQSKITSIKSIPGITQIKSRINKYILNGNKKLLHHGELKATDINVLVSLFSLSYKELHEYYNDWIDFGMDNNVKAHAELYIELYNFYLLQYLLQEKRRHQDGYAVDDRKLKRDYLEGPDEDYRIIRSASSGAFCMIQSFFLVSIVIPEFRNVSSFFEGPILNEIFKREHSLFNCSSYISNILTHILPSFSYDELMNIILENGKRVYGEVNIYFPEDIDQLEHQH